MAASKDIKFDSYCDTLYEDLSGMKAKLLERVEYIQAMSGPEARHVSSHAGHLLDIVKTIDWKLEILMKVCPADWKGKGETFESTASVQVEENASKLDSIVGGYVGG